MKIEVKASSVVYETMNQLVEIREFYSNVPRGAYICAGTRERRLYDNKEKAEKVICTIADTLQASEEALYRAAAVARRWHGRTGWRLCLPESDAGRLLACMMLQYPLHGGRSTRMEDMHLTITHWVEIARKRKLQTV